MIDLKHIYLDAHFDKEEEEEKYQFETSFESLFMAMIGEGLEGLKTKIVKSVESLSQTLKKMRKPGWKTQSRGSWDTSRKLKS